VATIELATAAPVMAMGGFSGGDARPTLAAFQADVASGKLRFVVVGGRGDGVVGRGAFVGRGDFRGQDGGSGRISAWVVANGKVVTAAGTAGGTLYDLAGASRATDVIAEPAGSQPHR
jgi:hypothetical protein